MKCKLGLWMMLVAGSVVALPGWAESPVEGTELAAAKAKRAQAMASMDYATLFAHYQRVDEIAKEATYARRAAEEKVASLKAVKGASNAHAAQLAEAEKALAQARKDEAAQSQALKAIRKSLARAKARTDATAERVAAVKEAMEKAESQPTQPETPKEETRP